MKKFLSKYSYRMVKLFVTQCVISLFGNVLALAGAKANSNALIIATSVFSILFYLFLIYMSAWETGSLDKPAIDGGRDKFSFARGLYIGLGANVPNFLFATIYLVLLPFATTVKGAASTICGISKLVFMFTNGMYTGIMADGVFAEGFSLHDYWFVYFLVTIPAIITTMLAYAAGAKDIHLTKALLPVTPEEQEIKRDQKREKNSKK